MPYDIENKLVIGIASSALFDLKECDGIFREKGREKYREYQLEHQDDTLPTGDAYPFIRRLLSLNDVFEEDPIEVVLLSKNDPDTGLRVMNSIKSYGLKIERSVFMSGKSPFQYIPAFNCALFLSADDEDVKKAIDAGYPAGTVLPCDNEADDLSDKELRIGFDFDGVIADDESEAVYQETGELRKFQDFETSQVDIPHGPGPLQGFFSRLAALQKIEEQRALKDPTYKPVLRTAIVTARSAPAHERLIATLRNWGVAADETIFLGGIEKNRILEILKPHIFFDDQINHLLPASSTTPSVHIPFGIVNR